MWQEPFAGGPLAVIALYQNGQIRPDILSLCLALRRQGVYIIAVNTGNLNAAGARLPVNCYLERRNYGRDFGSYRVGVRLAQTLTGEASRMVLLNDSVFYVSKGLDQFVTRLLNSRADICSATENQEIRPHQTSFCMSFSRFCFTHDAFSAFWKRYLATDLRPATVLFGEIALSRSLQRAGFSRETLAGRDAVQRLLESRPDLIPRSARDVPEAEHVQTCAFGNVTHRAPSALIELGVPLVKLDLWSRSGLDSGDLSELRARIPRQDDALLGEFLLRNAQSMSTRGPLDRLGARCGLA